MLTILGLTNPRGACYTTYCLNSLPPASQLCVQNSNASGEQGVNRGIRSILPPYATSPSSAPSHTRWAGLFPPIKTNKTHFLATNLPNRKIFWCILAICIPNREVVYLPEQMTRVTLALCSAPYDCAGPLSGWYSYTEWSLCTSITRTKLNILLANLTHTPFFILHTFMLS